MMNRQMLRMNERGSAGPGVIAGVVVLAIVIFLGVQLVPIYYDHWTMEDEFSNEKLNIIWVNIPDAKKVKEELNIKVKKLLNERHAQFKDKDVKITVMEDKKKIIIDVRYGRSHKVPFLQNPKMFHLKKENRPL